MQLGKKDAYEIYPSMLYGSHNEKVEKEIKQLNWKLQNGYEKLYSEYFY